MAPSLLMGSWPKAPFSKGISKELKRYPVRHAVVDDLRSQSIPVDDWDNWADEGRQQLAVALCKGCTSRWISLKTGRTGERSRKTRLEALSESGWSQPTIKKDGSEQRKRPLWRHPGLAGLDKLRKLKHILPVSCNGAVRKDYVTTFTAPNSCADLTPISLIPGSADAHYTAMCDEPGMHVMSVNIPQAELPSSSPRNRRDDMEETQSSLTLPQNQQFGTTSSTQIPIWGSGNIVGPGPSKNGTVKKKKPDVIVDAHTLKLAQSASKARQEQLGNLKSDLTDSMQLTYSREDFKHVGMAAASKKKRAVAVDKNPNESSKERKSFLMQLSPIMSKARNLRSGVDPDDDEIVALPKQELSSEEELFRKLAKATGVSTMDVEDVYEQYLQFLGDHNNDALLEIGNQSRNLLKMLRPDDPRAKSAADELEQALKDANASRSGNAIEKVEFKDFYAWFIIKFPLQKEGEENVDLDDLSTNPEGQPIRRSGWGGVSVVQPDELETIKRHSIARVSALNALNAPTRKSNLSAKSATQHFEDLLDSSTRSSVTFNDSITSSLPALEDALEGIQPRPPSQQLMLADAEQSPQE